MTTTTQTEITRIEFVNAPGVSRPTSTKVNHDYSARLTPEMLEYVTECRAMIAMVATELAEGLFRHSSKYGSSTTVADRRRNVNRMVCAIDAARFFNGDKAVERVLSAIDDILATPVHLAEMDMLVEFSESIGQLAARPRRGFSPEEQFSVEVGKRAAQAYERQERLKNKIAKASRKANRKK
jgi:hypothetical protein